MNEEVLLNQSLVETVQSIKREEALPNHSGSPLLFLLQKATNIVSPYWSRQRDVDLHDFWKKSDHISGAIYAVASKMSTIPFRVEARNKSIQEHVNIAKVYQSIMTESPEFGSGWIDFLSKWIVDYVAQDNGAFIEFIGDGDKSEEIIGPVISFAHLDSSRCMRTSNPIYPVIYIDADGRYHKMHHTRVSSAAQMPSSKERMNGVGFCSVSRAINTAQNLIDMSTYKQEKMGSRPARQMMLTGGGLDPEHLREAFDMANHYMDSQGLSRYSKTVVVGSSLLEKPTIELMDLASTPDGFDEKWATISGMAVIALAFGLEARELFPLMAESAGKADAVIQHIKQRGKTPGYIIQTLENTFNKKFLPGFAKMIFDYQDDSQDRQVADIRGTRAVTRERNIYSAVTDIRTERELMLENNEISEAQFEQLELSDGRLANGLNIDVLFYSDDKIIKGLLDGINESNYQKYIEDLKKIIMTSTSKNKIVKARQCLVAIEYRYNNKEEEEEKEEEESDENNKKLPVARDDTSYEGGEKFNDKRPKNVINNDNISSYYMED